MTSKPKKIFGATEQKLLLAIASRGKWVDGNIAILDDIDVYQLTQDQVDRVLVLMRMK